MSVQFGRWNIDGKPLALDDLKRIDALLAPYGSVSDACSYAKGSIGILYRAFHTTKDSLLERQPHVTESGTVLCWDGRLDNRTELQHELRDVPSIGATDAALVAKAYERWGKDCFAKLIGDWAISIWNPYERTLILAKDPIGTRHLYYSLDKERAAWSTVLDPLLLLADQHFTLNEEYIAGWFSLFPAAHLTPYVGIHSVPPSSLVCIRDREQAVRKYWDFDPAREIRYLSDSHYEEHFRAVFAEAVRRRLRSDFPVLAELSGGMDSSSIVCMADELIARGVGDTPGLDTISYYNDAEPHWNERPYFTKVEEKRGHSGFHVNLGSQQPFKVEYKDNRPAATPATCRHPSEAGRQFRACLAACGHRVLLSGTGGDEVTGGVPTPIPELEDLLARSRFGELAHKLKIWALEKRKPWVHLLFAAARGFFPLALADMSRQKLPAPWLESKFVRRNRAALQGYERRLRLFGPLPSFQESLGALDALRRQVECEALPSEPPYEKRYPFLDRDVLEFLFAVPREQLVRPGQRRSLMRRALRGIVPSELLNRKRKAYVVRTAITEISTQWDRLRETSQHLMVSSLGIVATEALSEALDKAHGGERIPIVTLMRTLGIEGWLRGLRDQGWEPALQGPRRAFHFRDCIRSSSLSKEFS